MKKVWALSSMAVLCLAVAAVAGGDRMGGKTREARIVKVDAAARVMTVRDAAGAETSLYWNDATKVEGNVKEGETIHYKATEKDGKMWATWFHVGDMHKM
jgi:hypothetical protein